MLVLDWGNGLSTIFLANIWNTNQHRETSAKWKYTISGIASRLLHKLMGYDYIVLWDPADISGISATMRAEY